MSYHRMSYKEWTETHADYRGVDGSVLRVLRRTEMGATSCPVIVTGAPPRSTQIAKSNKILLRREINRCA